jgi:hypothetical protein
LGGCGGLYFPIIQLVNYQITDAGDHQNRGDLSLLLTL